MHAISSDDLTKRLKAESHQGASWVFDCDGTVINGDIASMTAWYLLRSGLADPELLPLGWEDFMKKPSEYEDFLSMRDAIVAERGVMAVYEWEMFLHSGLPNSAVLSAAEAALKEAQKRGLAVYTNPVSRLLRQMKGQSWVVSGSPLPCVYAIVKGLGVTESQIICSQLEEVDGIFSAKLKAPGVVWEDVKRDCLEAKNIQPWIVFGDTIGDWAMMQLATDWVWAIVWDEHRFRGHEFREHLQKNLLAEVMLPKEPGLYHHKIGQRNWVFEIKFPGNI